MKKYLYSALALPLLFACSTDDFEKPVVSNDQFAGIEKVDATFSMDERATTRLDGELGWKAEEGDLWGFAWMGDGTVINGGVVDGKAYQNHNLIQTDGIFKPQTSIYIGKYYLYRPYDETTVSPKAIEFNSLITQPLAEGYESAKQPWKDLAKTAINIADKWTNVTVGGDPDPDVDWNWNEAGIKKHYKIYPAVFSNQTGLDLTYQKNNPTFAAAKVITGATDINYTEAAGTSVGAADIYEVTVGLAGAANSFTYAPTVEPNAGDHIGTFWAAKKNLAAVAAGSPGDGFNFTNEVITLTAPVNEETGLVEPVSTGDNGSTGWFWFNSLPVTAGGGDLATAVQTILTTSYGNVTVNSTVGDCAQVFDKYNAAATSNEWIKLAGADADNVTPKTWNLAGDHNTFINQYGNHKGKYVLTVDFSSGTMANMHIKDDTHLQKLLRYYIASGKDEVITLNLDGASATDKTFKLSKLSIALLQTINAGGAKVLVQACGTHNNPVKIVVTQDGQAAKNLADKTEVPALNNVFAAATDVYLASGTVWTWKGGDNFETALPIDANVSSITNEGTLTVNAKNVQLSVAAATLANAKGATMNITKVTTVKNALTNLGTINVGSTSNTDAQLRAYGVEIKNDATDAKDLTKRGTINNYGVIGSSDGVAGSQVNNYGEINVMNDDAITLLRSNELGMPAFASTFADDKKMGSVVIPSPFALVSVSNGAENGFIKYTWPAATTTYATPTGGVVKYNTIIVSGDIAFTEDEAEIQYIEFNGTRTQVVNPAAADDDTGYLDNLKGIIVNAGKSIIIEKTNGIIIPAATGSAFLGAGATVYKGGRFIYPATAPTNNYFGTWTPADQVVVW